MSKLTALEFVGLGCMSAGFVVTLFNMGMTGGARNGAARLAWALVGMGIGVYVYYAFTGMLYALDNGVVGARRSNFHRDEHPLLYGIVFIANSLATCVVAGASLTCFWKAFKKG